MREIERYILREEEKEREIKIYLRMGKRGKDRKMEN